MVTTGSPLRISIVDSVLDEIGSAIAPHPPERGGALLGPRGSLIVSELITDLAAKTTAASYEPSDALRLLVREREAATGVRLTGITHSHPPGIDRPSGPDEKEMAKALSSNPGLLFYLAPINTNGQGRGALKRHEVALAHGKASVYIARATLSGVEIGPAHLNVMPVSRDIGSIGAELGANGASELGATEIDGRQLLQAALPLDGGACLNFLLSEYYPASPPIVLLSDPRGRLAEVAVEWSLAVKPEERLLSAIGPELDAIASGEALARAEASPGSAGPRPAIAKVGRSTRRRINRGLESRLGKKVGREMRQRHVLVLGAGSVGSAIAETLVRSGVGGLTVVDPDLVTLPNLARPSYDFDDIGHPKPVALAARLSRINPGIRLKLRNSALQELAVSEAYDLVQRADLVVAATDDPEAQILASQLAYHAGVAAVFPALYREAKGGEVFVQVPERTACYLCATSMHSAGQDEDVRGSLDYGTRRLEAQVAIPADVHHVAIAGAKLSLSLLLEGKAEIGDFLQPQLASGESYLTLSMSPGFWFFDRLLEGVPGQYAYAAAWLAPQRDPRCTICGAHRQRTDPRRAQRQSPSGTALRAAARQQSATAKRPRGRGRRPRRSRRSRALFTSSRRQTKVSQEAKHDR